jgi:nitrile hydratase
MSGRFAPGARVRVRRAYPPGHLRTPYYIRGRTGVVERLCGAFRNPEELAFGRNGEPAQPLYRVRFAQREVWPDYAGESDDTLDVELYEHWLEPA